MFGTLIICLPSAHEGGDVIVKHNHEEKTLRSSRMEQGFMCWYSDVQHEVLPVTSGYRWVLTYNLALDASKERPGASLPERELSPLRDYVSQWLDALKERRLQLPESLIYALDHHYTEAGLSLKAFKGRDLAVARALRSISSQLPIDVFLGILEKRETGSCLDDDADWHSLKSVESTSFKINMLADLDGVHLAKEVRFENDALLQPDCFDGLDGEETDFQEGCYYSGKR